MTLLVLYPAAFLCAVAWGVLAGLVGIDGFAFGAVVFVLILVAVRLVVSAVERPFSNESRARHAALVQDRSARSDRGRF